MTVSTVVCLFVLLSTSSALPLEKWMKLRLDRARNQLSDLHILIDAPSACASVKIITRQEWGARAPLPPSPQPIPLPTNMSFVHHTAGNWTCHTEETCKEQMRSIQNFHMDTRGFSDIGYSYVIGEDGNVYEGRTWGVEGAHTRGYNTAAHGYCVIGNFMTRLPNQLALDALKNILQCGVERFFTTPDYELFGHRDAGCTLCPGDYLYKEIQTWPHYSHREIPKHC